MALPRKLPTLLCLALLALAGLWLRSSIFQLEFRAEGDEKIYGALVDQLLHGAGYTLRGHPILQTLSAPMYDAPTFFHPPFGTLFFALFAVLGGDKGMQAAQLVCFLIFFVSLVVLARKLFPALSEKSLVFCGLLAVFTPIFVHTNMKMWIDNPRVAFFTLHFLLVVLAVEKNSRLSWFLAAITALIPALTKSDSVSAYPFAYWIALQRAPAARRGQAIKILAALFFAAVAAALGWMWHADTLAHRPGRPDPGLIEKQFFVYYVTEKLSSGWFLFEYVQIVGSLLPAALITLLALGKKGSKEWNIRLALLAWIFSHAALFALLGSFGYSKVHRYLAMTIPASSLLVAAALEKLQTVKFKNAMLTAMLLGATLEVAQGVTEAVFHPKLALIFPILTGPQQ